MKTIFSAGVLVVAAAMLAGCHANENATATVVETVKARVVLSRQAETPIAMKATGTLRAHESATISAQVMGRIVAVRVREGDPVKAGQVLVTLDDAMLRAGVDQARAGASAARNAQAAAQTEAALAASTLDRFRKLQTEKSVSPQEMDEVARRAEGAQARVEAMRAQAEAATAQESGARTQLGYTQLRAPFAGVVSARMADPGSMAAPGVPLLQVDSGGPVELNATVDESMIAAIHKSAKVDVTVGAATLAGTVAQIQPAADPMSHTFMVKIALPASAAARAGMYGTAEFSAGTRNAILAPRSAIVMRGSLACAYVLDANGIAQLRYVTLGAAHGAEVEVLSGLGANEKLIDTPADRELAGKRIEVQP